MISSINPETIKPNANIYLSNYLSPHCWILLLLEKVYKRIDKNRSPISNEDVSFCFYLLNFVPESKTDRYFFSGDAIV